MVIYKICMVYHYNGDISIVTAVCSFVPTIITQSFSLPLTYILIVKQCVLLSLNALNVFNVMTQCGLSLPWLYSNCCSNIQ